METLYSAHPGVCPQTRTIHYITTSLFQLKEYLVSHLLKHFGSMRLGLNIQSTSIHNHRSWAGLLTDDRKHCPSPPGAHELVGEENKTSENCDTPDIRKRQPHSPHRSSEQSCVTQSSGVRASCINVDLEKISWHQGWQRPENKEDESAFPAEGGPPQRCKIRSERDLPENSKYSVLE